MSASKKTDRQPAKKKASGSDVSPLVVKLNVDDRQRLDYICEKIDLPKAKLIRYLIRRASEGEVRTESLTMRFTPYSEAHSG